MRLCQPLDSIHFRVGAMLTLVLVACAALVVYTLYQPSDGERQTYMVISPADLRATVAAVEQSPRQGLAPLVQALAASGTTVQILATFPADAAPAVAALEQRLPRYREALPGRPMRIHMDGGTILASAYDDRAVATRPLYFLIGLRDGRVVKIMRASAPIVGRILSNLTVLLVTVAAIALIATLLIAQQMSLPVRRMARALRARDGNLDGGDLPVIGARELKELALAFNRMRGSLRNAMDDRTRVLAAIAHDMRTYLTRLALRLDHITDARQRALAQADLSEMTVMLNSTLVFADAVTQEIDYGAGHIDITPVIGSIVEGRTALGQKVSVRIDGYRPMNVPISVVSVHRIVANLVDNAIRYGGSADITLSEDKGAVCLIVEDDGPGVPNALLSELTKPFFCVDGSRTRTHGGHGLGLAIVDALICRQGGSLELTNRASGGLRATVRFRVSGQDQTRR